MHKKAAALASTGFSQEFTLREWSVRPALNELERSGRVHRLESRSMAVLVELAKRGGALASKRRLIESVWGNAFVSDDVLSHAISEIRRALGDSPRNPEYIQTVPRKGYCLIAPVEWASSAGRRGGQVDFPYEIHERIGGGGMGIVYRAEDTRLKRTVALKFLPPDLVADPEAKDRLLREARAAAALEHRNIATVFDLGQDPEGQMFLTMAYYRGETLREKIAVGPLSIERVCRYGRQIAEGLAAAHGRGIVHRDIKPENLIVTEEGEVKIVDFGLAKLATSTPLTLTSPGVTPGTALYMSPESLQGEGVGFASDLWSLGVVLYEMLLGSPPFEGPSALAVMQSILEAEVDSPIARRPETPAALARLILELLRRDPAARAADAGLVASRLAELGQHLELGKKIRPAQILGVWWHARAYPSLLRLWRAWSPRLKWAALGALAASLALLPRLLRPAEQGPGQVLAYDLRLPPGVSFAEGADSSASVSRDGEWVVFVGEDRSGALGLWALSLDGKAQRRLPGISRPGQPFWSPDRKYVGFFEANRLRVQALAGGPSREIAAVSSEYRGASWGNGGQILYSPGTRDGVYLVQEKDGSSRQLTEPDRSRQEIGHLWPQFLPDGEHFLYFVSSNREEVRGIYLATLGDSPGRKILASDASATYASGYILYLEASNLMARPFDLGKEAFSGPQVPIAEGVASFFTFQGVVSASSTGVLVYSKETQAESTELRWVDHGGQTLEVLAESGEYRNPAMSRDGRYAVIESHSGTEIKLELIELETGRLRKVGDESAHQSMFPVLSADGEQVIFTVEDSKGIDLRRVRPNSTDPVELLMTSDLPLAPSDWSPDGRYILMNERGRDGDYDMVAFDLEIKQTVPVLNQPDHEGSGRFSPGGRRMAYVSNETGRFEVYIESFPRSGRRCQASGQGGLDPHWSTEDRLYYLSPTGTAMVVDIERLEACALARPVALFDARVEPPASSRSHFSIAGSSDRLLVNSALGGGEHTNQVAVLAGWIELVIE